MSEIRSSNYRGSGAVDAANNEFAGGLMEDAKRVQSYAAFALRGMAQSRFVLNGTDGRKDIDRYSDRFGGFAKASDAEKIAGLDIEKGSVPQVLVDVVCGKKTRKDKTRDHFMSFDAFIEEELDQAKTGRDGVEGAEEKEEKMAQDGFSSESSSSISEDDYGANFEDDDEAVTSDGESEPGGYF